MLEDPRIAAIRSAADPNTRWDVIVIGGGATGLATAWDAISRGLKVALIEAEDFTKSTSSRSTKLVHGGVRYLQKGEVGLVREALHERARLLYNAAEFTRPLRFILPTTHVLAGYYYRFGMLLYDFLAGQAGIERAKLLSRSQVEEKLPGIVLDGLAGGVAYSDAQFDDTALAIATAQAIQAGGGVVLNYAKVSELLTEKDKIIGVKVDERETGESWEMRAKVVINATGIFSDVLRKENDVPRSWTVRTSRGSHLVCPRSVMPGDHGLIIPKTKDGRVLFAIPWKQHVVIGTTDVPTDEPMLDPAPNSEEVSFILEEASLALGVTAEQVTSRWAGLRPLVSRAGVTNTAKLSRKHIIETSPRGMISVLGGKWTTARKMGEDAVDAALECARIAAPPSSTADRPLTRHGARPPADGLLDEGLALDQERIIEACRYGFARTLEDVMTRRFRWLQLDAQKALEAAPEISRIMAKEFHWDEAKTTAQLEIFKKQARPYLG